LLSSSRVTLYQYHPTVHTIYTAHYITAIHCWLAGGRALDCTAPHSTAPHLLRQVNEEPEAEVLPFGAEFQVLHVVVALDEAVADRAKPRRRDVAQHLRHIALHTALDLSLFRSAPLHCTTLPSMACTSLQGTPLHSTPWHCACHYRALPFMTL
jgi:hypothetical protein